MQLSRLQLRMRIKQGNSGREMHSEKILNEGKAVSSEVAGLEWDNLKFPST